MTMSAARLVSARGPRRSRFCDGRLSLVTRGEWRTVELLSERGWTQPKIAEFMGISVSLVADHIYRRSRARAAKAEPVLMLA